MQLDDFSALVERGCLLGEAHHEHGPNGEVGSDQHADIIMPGEDRTQLVQSLLGEPRGAHNSVNSMIDTPRDVVDHRLWDG